MNHQQLGRPKKLILKGTPEELASLVAKKVMLIATRYADVPIVCETATAKECRQESHLAKSLVLLILYSNDENENINDEVIAVATSRAMMKAVASMAAANRSKFTSNTMSTVRNNLMGNSIADDAMIDGWLNYIWTSIDLPLQILVRLLVYERSTSKANIAKEKEAIENDLNIALKQVEKSLSQQQSSRRIENDNRPLYIVATTISAATSTITDPSYTLADLCLAVTLHFMLEKNIAVEAITSKENPHLYDWNQRMQTALDLS